MERMGFYLQRALGAVLRTASDPWLTVITQAGVRAGRIPVRSGHPVPEPACRAPMSTITAAQRGIGGSGDDPSGGSPNG